jgi:hypothetical protein
MPHIHNDLEQFLKHKKLDGSQSLSEHGGREKSALGGNGTQFPRSPNP